MIARQGEGNSLSSSREEFGLWDIFITHKGSPVEVISANEIESHVLSDRRMKKLVSVRLIASSFAHQDEDEFSGLQSTDGTNSLSV